MNFSLMATYGGDLSLRHFLVLEARAIPFEVAHVLGNVVLALVAGPAMVRMLVRFRERFEWERRGEAPTPAPRGRIGGALRSGGVAAALLLALSLALAPAPAQASSVSRAADWLEAQQRPSGGFPADPGGEAGTEMTSWAMLGLAAAGRNPLDVTNGGKSPVDFLRSHLSELGDPGDVARTILALEAAGVDPREFGGEDLVERLVGERSRNGSYQGWPATSAYAVLALRAAGATDATAPTVEWLRNAQGKEGGWGNLPRDTGTAEITGAVLQVLTPGSEASDRGLAYLREGKRPSGGFAPGNNLAANAQATAWASQGLLAVGKDPAGFGKGKSSFTYMRELQVDDGHFLQAPGQEGSAVWITADVLVPLAGKHLPVSAPEREPQPKPLPIDNSADSGGIAPSPSVPLPTPESSGPSAFQEAFEGGSRGPSSGHSAPPGQGGPGLQPAIPPTGGRVPEGDLGSPPREASDLQYGEQASESADDSDSSATGAILLGLLAGCLLFGLGLAGRRGWMRWRYGL
jgi:energy-coupling factor transport system substrate-specific component